MQCTWCVHAFPAEDGRKRYQSAASVPAADATSRETSEVGEVADSAAKVLITIFFAARVARLDALRAVTHLACFFAKW